MCYFINIVLDKKIPDSTIEKYANMDIYIRELTRNVVNRLSSKFYYDITNQCSCDFISPDEKRNQSKSLKELFQSLITDSSISFCIVLDNNKYSNLGSEIQGIINSFPNNEINLKTFLELYPNLLDIDTVYEITPV